MNASMLDTHPLVPDAAPTPPRASRTQITMSPYYGRPDFTGVASGMGESGPPRNIDLVSVADILRIAFVFPPHSIFEDVKLVTFGFSPAQDMNVTPEFHFKFRDSGKRTEDGSADGEVDWVGIYHRLLCEAVSNSTRDVAHPWMLQSG